MSYQSVFKRYEIKYLVTDEQKKMIMREMQNICMPTNTAKAQFATYILTHLIFTDKTLS